MLKFSANVSMMFTEEPDPLKRISRAKEAGFGAAEFLFVYDIDVDAMAEEFERTDMKCSVINVAVGEGIKMGPLVAAAPGKEHAWKENVIAAVPYCKAMQPAGFVIPANTIPEGVDRADAREVFKENLIYVADIMDDIGTKVIVEPLNPAIRANAMLSTSDETMALLEEIGHPNLGLEYDAYHMHVTEGKMVETVRKYLPHIGNIQIADVPGRHEPGTGEINYDNFLNSLNDMGYSNWVACEYTPTGATTESLGWMQKWLSMAILITFTSSR